MNLLQFLKNETKTDTNKKKLPIGWEAVPSRSNPGKTSYRNQFTGERISWFPTKPASLVIGNLPEEDKIKTSSSSGSSNDSYLNLLMDRLNQNDKQLSLFDQLKKQQNKQNTTIKDTLETKYNQSLQQNKKYEAEIESNKNKKGNTILTNFNRLVQHIESTFWAYDNELKYYPFFMDPLETAWNKEKIEWVEKQLKLQTIKEIHDKQYDFSFKFYFYGTLWDCGTAYRLLLSKYPCSKYWNEFLKAYQKALQNRHSMILKYEKTQGGKVYILCPQNNQWIEETKMYQYYKQGFCQ